MFWMVLYVEIDRRFRGAYCPCHQTDRPYDGGNKYLWTVCQFPRKYIAQHAGRQVISYAPPSEPELSQKEIQ